MPLPEAWPLSVSSLADPEDKERLSILDIVDNSLLTLFGGGVTSRGSLISWETAAPSSSTPSEFIMRFPLEFRLIGSEWMRESEDKPKLPSLCSALAGGSEGLPLKGETAAGGLATLLSGME